MRSLVPIHIMFVADSLPSLKAVYRTDSDRAWPLKVARSLAQATGPLVTRSTKGLTRPLDAYGYMASMAVMPEGHRDHKTDIPNNISQEAKQEASKSCPNCKIPIKGE